MNSRRTRRCPLSHHVVHLLSAYCILLGMALSLRSPRLVAASGGELPSVESLVENRRVSRALAAVEQLAFWTTEQQIRLTEIAAPTFQEAARAAAVRKLFAASGLRTRIDGAGNVIGERPGALRKDVLLISAHLDTVFPPRTPVKVQRDGRRLAAPGISDNGAGLAAIVWMIGFYAFLAGISLVAFSIRLYKAQHVA